MTKTNEATDLEGVCMYSTTIQRQQNTRTTSKLAIMIGSLFSFEMTFILYLFAGRFKADPRFSWIPVDLTALFFGLSVLIGIWIVAKRGGVLDKKPVILVFMYALLLLYVLFSYIWSPSDAYAGEKMGYLFTLTLWALAGPTLIISQERKRMIRFFSLLFAFALWMAIESTIAFMQASGSFITVLGGNYLGIGRVLGLASIVLFAYALFFAKGWKAKVIGYLLFFYFMFLMLNIGARGPLLAVVGSILFPLLLSWKPSIGDIRIKKHFVPIIIIILFAVMYGSYLFSTNQLPSTVSRLQVIFQSEDMGSSAGARMHYYEKAGELWGENVVFGHGVGSWPVLTTGMDERAYPHNIILELGVELGLIGVVLFVVMVGYALRQIKTYRTLQNNAWALLLLMLLINLLINAMISGDLNDNRYLLAFLGLFFFLNKESASLDRKGAI
ncbi:O-antigen ligase family protein [Bacillus tianshenii]|nr:O-antigen ligase family protein [Bacillus tianshenii]